MHELNQSSLPSTPTVAGAGSSLQELAERAHSQDATAFHELSRRLLRTFTWLGRERWGADPASAEQLAHQTVSEALQAISSGRYDARRVKFITFAYAVHRRVTLRHLADRKRSFQGLSEQARTLPSRVDEDEFAVAERIEALLGCVRSEGVRTTLSEEERYVVIGLTHQKTLAELAKELGKSLDTIHRRKVQGLEKLRQCMAAKGYTGWEK